MTEISMTPTTNSSSWVERGKTPNFDMPDYTAAARVAEAYQAADAGRKQAALATARLQSHIFRHPENLIALKQAAMQWLAGTDLTASGGVPAASQAIVRRLNDALDGHGQRITKTLLSNEEIARIRLFRRQVRELLTN